MPSTSKKQAKFMAAAAHNPKFAKKAGIKQSVAKDFNASDQLRGMLKKAKGGKVSILNRLKNHELWDAADYRNLKDKGYSDPEIKELWDGDSQQFAREREVLGYDRNNSQIGRQIGRVDSDGTERKVSDSTKRLKPTVREEGRKTEVTPADEGETSARADVAGRKEYASGGLATLRQAASQLEADVGTSTKGRSRPSARVRKPRKGMAGVLGDADSSLGSTGNRLADVAQRLAEGGKVGAAALALRQLAKKFESALQMEDHSGARRIAQQMELMEPGSSQEAMRAIQRPVDRVVADKLATFAKGGKVGNALKSLKKYNFETTHPITRDLNKNDWKVNLGDDLEDAGHPRSATKHFRLTKEPEWVDRDSNNPSHGNDYYNTEVEGPAHMVDAMEAKMKED